MRSFISDIGFCCFHHLVMVKNQRWLFFNRKPFGMKSLIQICDGHIYPSRAYEEGGIHEAIADYEDAVFFEILAEELARRDMDYAEIIPERMEELTTRMEAYMAEFEHNGVENISIDNM